MNYEEFIIQILKEVSIKLGDNYEIMCKDVVKNNSCVFKSLYIIDKYADSDNRITPAIFLECWFDKYQSGESIDTISDNIVKTYYKSINISEQFDIASISKDNIESNVFYRLVNYEANKEQLLDIPYIPFLDMALTFHYRCAGRDNTVNSFRINDTLMKMWGLSVDDLFEYAERNMPEMFPDVLTSMDSVLQQLMYGVSKVNEFTGFLYVLTNKYGINGATTLLYTTKIHKLAKMIDCDIYIIPSSIHEVLLLPAFANVDGNEIRELVKEVNSTYVLPEEVLSDNVYIFNKNTCDIDIYKNIQS